MQIPVTMVSMTDNSPGCKQNDHGYRIIEKQALEQLSCHTLAVIIKPDPLVGVLKEPLLRVNCRFLFSYSNLPLRYCYSYV